MATDDLPSWLRDEGAHCVLDVAIQPGASRTEISGLHDGALRIRVAAPALDGRGNAALIAWLAKALDCPRKHIELLRGDKSRRKQLRVLLRAAEVRSRLDPLIPAPRAPCA